MEWDSFHPTPYILKINVVIRYEYDIKKEIRILTR